MRMMLSSPSHSWQWGPERWRDLPEAMWLGWNVGPVLFPLLLSCLLGDSYSAWMVAASRLQWTLPWVWPSLLQPPHAHPCWASIIPALSHHFLTHLTFSLRILEPLVLRGKCKWVVFKLSSLEPLRKPGSKSGYMVIECISGSSIHISFVFWVAMFLE